jgi:hypothetical protein
VLIIYLLGLWKDHAYNPERNQEDIAHNVREKYIKLYILQTLIGQIGIIEIVRLFVQTVIKDKKIPEPKTRPEGRIRLPYISIYRKFDW